MKYFSEINIGFLYKKKLFTHITILKISTIKHIVIILFYANFYKK